MPLWLNASDVVLLTSLHEGSPNVIKEALACNVPIVSVDVGDVSERINGVNGSYIAKANPQDLAGKLRLVVSGERRTNGRSAMCELSSGARPNCYIIFILTLFPRNREVPYAIEWKLQADEA